MLSSGSDLQAGDNHPLASGSDDEDGAASIGSQPSTDDLHADTQRVLRGELCFGSRHADGPAGGGGGGPLKTSSDDAVRPLAGITRNYSAPLHVTFMPMQIGWRVKWLDTPADVCQMSIMCTCCPDQPSYTSR